MLIVIMLRVLSILWVILPAGNAIMLGVLILSVIMLSVIILNTQCHSAMHCNVKCSYAEFSL
jgi:hypothetical protein